MDDWRRPSHVQQQQQGGGGFYHQGGGGGGGPYVRSASKHGRPPPSGSWQPTVPAWEKKFCYHVCQIPWGRICETKKVMSYYKSIVDWDDSAGEEAFHSAKARFWAKINNLPCPISLPDPDMYIDKIDWDAVIDPELISDLDKQPPPPVDGEKDEKLSFLSSGWDSSIFENKPIPCTGWGEPEDPTCTPPKCSPAEPSWGNWDLKGESGNTWNPTGPVKDSPAEPSWGNWDTNGNRCNAWDPAGAVDASAQHGWGNWDANGGNDSGWICTDGWGNEAFGNHAQENKWDNTWGLGDSRYNEVNYSEPRRYGRKREGGAQYCSGHLTSRHPVDDYQANNTRWRNCRGRRWATNGNWGSAFEKKPLATDQWNSMHSCGPINRQASAGTGSTWRWEKPIS